MGGLDARPHENSDVDDGSGNLLSDTTTKAGSEETTSGAEQTDAELQAEVQTRLRAEADLA